MLKRSDMSRIGRVRLAGAAIAMACIVPLGLTAGCGPNSNNTASASGASGGATSTSVVCQKVGSVNFDKTKFVFHAGLAFGAFHHFIYNRFKSGGFQSGASGRIKNLIEAGLAGLFVVHELKLVKADAESSPTLCHLVGPLDQAGAALTGLKDKLKNGSATQQDLDGVNNQINSAQQSFSNAGVPAPDQVPSASQLATGSA
jgi:hypothetical protein